MSASPMARKVTDCQAIPTKRVFIKDPSELPSDYSSTPGGTLYSTTPGGTRIVYDKSHLLNLRNSPISKTPPTFEIPNTILKGSPPQFKITKARSNKRSIIKNQIAVPPKESVKIDDSEDQFAIDL